MPAPSQEEEEEKALRKKANPLGLFLDPYNALPLKYGGCSGTDDSGDDWADASRRQKYYSEVD